MARTIEEIMSSMLTAKENSPVLSGLGNSASAIWRLMFYIVASAHYIVEKLFDLHVAEVDAAIADKNPGTTRWYAWIARQFQFGFNLLPDSSQFDNTDRTEEEIRLSKIIAYSACVELPQPGGKLALLIKVAKEDAGLEPLSDEEKEAFTEYVDRIRYAGTNTTIVSVPGDELKLGIEVFYNPLVLNAVGQRLDGSSLTPVKDAIDSFLKNLPFNGIFVNAFLVDALQQVPGVVIPDLRNASYKYGELPWLPIKVSYQPYSGWLRIANPDTDLEITYTPQSEL